MRTITVNARQGQKSIDTDLTPSNANNILADSASNFAQDLRNSYRRGRMSVVQENWFLLLAQEVLNRKAEKVEKPTISLGNLVGINKLFDDARKHLKYPKIKLALTDGSVVMLKPRRQGGINVSNGERFGSPENVYYGRIAEDGSFDARNPNPEVVDLLKRFAIDPAHVASEYGRLTGNCSFCAKELTDERSTEVGYGPVCAVHYGLPWGHKHAQVA